MTTTMTTKPRPRRERPKVIKLTDAAAERILSIMEQSEGRYIGVRVGVKNGGCAGMSYTMDYAESAGPFDEVVEDKGVQIGRASCRERV
jgi:iron-sulfur cluster assembly protein